MGASAEYCTRPSIKSVVKVDQDALVIDGLIDDALVNEVQATLNTSTNLIKRIQITSYGGKNESMTQLVAAVAILGPIPIEIPTICQSACIGFLAYTPGQKHIAPAAILMFHSSSLTAAPRSNIPFCWCWASWDAVGNLFDNTRADIGLVDHRVMLPWAAQLSDRLPALFSLCPVNPLDTKRGMFLTGQEYNDLHDGIIAPVDLKGSCPSDRS
jgi:hypothetical protein